MTSSSHNKDRGVDIGPVLGNKQLAYVGLALLFWLGAFYPDIVSAMKVWAASETFTHCFLVLPGAVYLAWCKRAEFLPLEPKPSYKVALLLIPVLLLALVGAAGDIQLFSHIAAFTSLPIIMWAVLGHKVAKVLRFPLIFILFSIPIGGELVPLFQQITANISLALLDLTTVPVYRDGLYISIPAGRFVVAEACSGIRFFIACIAFGAVLAHLSYKRVSLKILLMVLAVLIPIAANGIRVFATILVGHYFGMEHASGTDHLVFGWGFFALVMLLLIGVAELVALLDTPKAEANDDTVVTHNVWRYVRWQPVALLSIALLLMYVAVKQLGASAAPLPQKLQTKELPVHAALNLNDAVWTAKFLNADDYLLARDVGSRPYTQQAIEYYLAWYKHSEPGAELIAGGHRFFNDNNWSLVNTQPAIIAIQGMALETKIMTITSGQGVKRKLLYWYELSNARSSQKVEVKLRQALNGVMGLPTGGAVIVIALPYSGSEAEAEEQLKDYINKHYHDFRAALPFTKHE